MFNKLECLLENFYKRYVDSMLSWYFVKFKKFMKLFFLLSQSNCLNEIQANLIKKCKR